MTYYYEKRKKREHCFSSSQMSSPVSLLSSWILPHCCSLAAAAPFIPSMFHKEKEDRKGDTYVSEARLSQDFSFHLDV